MSEKLELHDTPRELQAHITESPLSKLGPGGLREALWGASADPSLGLLLDSIREGVALIRVEDRRLEWANRAFLDALALPRGHCQDLRCCEGPACGLELEADCPVLRAQESGRLEEAVHEEKGGKVWRLRGIPILEDGRVAAVLELREDITLFQKISGELERSHKEFDRLFGEQEERTQRLIQEHEMFLDKTTEFAYRHDESGVFTYLSPSVEPITGYSVEEWCQHYCQYLTEHPDNDWVVLATERTLRTGERSDPYRVEIIHKNGSRVTLEVDEEPVLEDGRVTGIVGVARDVTDRVLAERAGKEARRTLQVILDSLPLRVYWKDVESRYQGCNQIFAEDAGLAGPEDLVGLSDHDLVWKNEAQLHRDDDFEVMQSGEAVLDYEVKVKTPGGDEVWHRESKIPLRDDVGEVVGLLGVYEDISTRRTALMENRNLLLDILEEKTRHLVELRDQIGRRQGRRSETGDGADPRRSHREDQALELSRELSYPLEGALTFIGQRLQEELPDLERKNLIDAQISAKTLLSLLGDLLRSSGEKESDRNLRQPFNLEALLSDALELVRGRAVRKGIALEKDCSSALPRRVSGERLWLRRTLFNLLAHAVKHTTRGWVRLELRPSPGEEACVEFTIRDSGEGFTPERLAELLKRGEEEAGSLAASKMLVERMGGRFEVRSEPGRGTSVRFHLPLPSRDPVPARRSDPPAAPSASRRLRRILLLGGSAERRAETRRELERAGCEVEDSGSFVRGTELSRLGLFDAVLFDCDADLDLALNSARTLQRQQAGSVGSIQLGLSAKPERGLERKCREVGMLELLDRRMQRPELDRLLGVILAAD